LLQEGLFNGSPQFQKEDDPNLWLAMDKNGKWAVKTSESKKANDKKCSCRCVVQGLLLPVLAKEWLVGDGQNLILQPEVVVSDLVYSPLPLYPPHHHQPPSLFPPFPRPILICITNEKHNLKASDGLLVAHIYNIRVMIPL